MSAGFRSWLAGVLGRFSSVPSVPSTSTDGIGIIDTQQFSVIFAGNELGIYRDEQTFAVCYDKQDFKTTTATKTMPMIYSRTRP